MKKSPRWVDTDAIAQEVQAHPKIKTYLNCSCFGLYEGNLLGAVQIDHSRPNAETLLHLRAGNVVVATGAFETQFLFANNDLPGVMLSTAVLRLIHRHGSCPANGRYSIGDAAQVRAVAGRTGGGRGWKWWRACPSNPSSAPGARITSLEW